MKKDIIIIFIILLISLYLLRKVSLKDAVYVKSNIDNNMYLVRDLEDKQDAADMLAKLRKRMDILVLHLYENKNKTYKDYKKYIKQLKRRLKSSEIAESSEDSVYTSYSVNKGEEVVFCLRSKKVKNKMHDINLMMYVVLHELAHVATPEYGHTALFKKNFAFLTNTAIDLNIYTKIEFTEKPKEYCGLTITDSIV